MTLSALYRTSYSGGANSIADAQQSYSQSGVLALCLLANLGQYGLTRWGLASWHLRG